MRVLNKANKRIILDPVIKEQKVDDQEIYFDAFISKLKLALIMVTHFHIKDNFELVREKLIIDTMNFSERDFSEL